jgi:predicted Zn-dependent protease
MLPKSVFDALAADDVSSDAFNIFAKYISQLATSALFDISLSSSDEHLQVKICKR